MYQLICAFLFPHPLLILVCINSGHVESVGGVLYSTAFTCCCFLTLTDPLRIQPWSQDRRNQTKSNRESERSMESRQKKDGQEVASKGHRRDKIENIYKKHTDSRNKLEPTA